jgi:hypothetical protein
MLFPLAFGVVIVRSVLFLFPCEKFFHVFNTPAKAPSEKGKHPSADPERAGKIFSSKAQGLRALPNKVQPCGKYRIFSRGWPFV